MSTGSLSDSVSERPRKNADVRDELLADGTMVLFQTTTRQLITLNRTAALVWEFCDGTHTKADIVDQIRGVFPYVPDVEHDVDTILQDLHARGIIGSER